MISFQQVSKRFRRANVLSDINLDIDTGDRVALVGSNGAGKTTLIRCLLGEYKCKGVISVVGNVDPTRMSEMVKKALDGDFQRAQDLHYELYDLMKVLFIESNPVPAKTALNMMGRPAGDVRMPLAPLKTENQDELKKVLLDLQLI